MWQRFGRRYFWCHFEGRDWLVTVTVGRHDLWTSIYASMTGPCLRTLHYSRASCPTPVEDFLMGSARDTIKRIREQQLKKRTGSLANCAWLSKQAPTLHELMAVPVTDGKQLLDTASLTVFCQDGSFKFCLNDRATHMQLWVAAEGFLEALVALEAKLVDPEADWRPQPAYAAKRKK